VDRIEKALSKSRHIRPNTADPYDKRSRDKALENIEYTHTSVVNIDPSTFLENRIVSASKTDPRATNFKLLRTKVLQSMKENNWRSLMVTGPTSGVGKTFTAVNLAISISLDLNQSVLLVDLDLRHPNIHEVFGIKPDYGLLDHLEEDISVSDILLNPSMPRLVLLPNTRKSVEPSEQLSSPKMQQLFKELASRYRSRIVIYDTPPLLNMDDAMVIMPYIDSALMVVEDGKTTKSDIQDSLRLLGATNFLGMILNKSDNQ